MQYAVSWPLIRRFAILDTPLSFSYEVKFCLNKSNIAFLRFRRQKLFFMRLQQNFTLFRIIFRLQNYNKFCTHTICFEEYFDELKCVNRIQCKGRHATYATQSS